MITFLFLTACVNRQEADYGKEEAHFPVDTIVWSDFTESDIEGAFPAKNLVQNKRYILLDSSEKYLFGAADKILFRDDIYVLDKRQKKIVVFDKLGNGMNVLHRLGQGPGEYLQITDFSVAEDGTIYIVDGVSDKLMVYNNQCEFVSSKKLPFEVDIIQCLPNKNFLLGLSRWNTVGKTKGKRIVVASEDLTIKNIFLDFDEYYDDSYWISYYSFASNGTNIFYNKPIEDMIYSFSNDGNLNKAFYVDFDNHRIPLDWRKDIESNMEAIKENYRCLKNQTIITDKYILGTLWDKTETKPFIADRKNNRLYLNAAIADSDISDIGDFWNSSIISLVYSGKYDNLENLDLPISVRQHIENDNYVLCITELL